MQLEFMKRIGKLFTVLIWQFYVKILLTMSVIVINQTTYVSQKTHCFINVMELEHK